MEVLIPQVSENQHGNAGQEWENMVSRADIELLTIWLSPHANNGSGDGCCRRRSRKEGQNRKRDADSHEIMNQRGGGRIGR